MEGIYHIMIAFFFPDLKNLGMRGAVFLMLTTALLGWAAPSAGQEGPAFGQPQIYRTLPFTAYGSVKALAAEKSALERQLQRKRSN